MLVGVMCIYSIVTTSTSSTASPPKCIMKAEFLTQVGPLMIIVVYAPTNQDSAEEKDQLQVIDKLDGVVGLYGLECTTSDNGE